MHGPSAAIVLLALVEPAFAGHRSAYTLRPPVTYPTDTMATAARLADITGDGALDVVVAAAGWDGPSNEVLVFPQLADGTLGEAVDFPFGGGSLVHALAVGDVDGDDADDVVVSPWLGGAYVFYGTGFGRIDGPYAVDSRESHDILAADLDGDGRADVVTVSGEGIHTFEHVPGGTFTEGLVAAPSWGWELAYADVTGDGVADLVSAGSSWAWMLLVYAGRGDGTLDAPLTWTEGRSSLEGALATGDFDGDGATDVVVAGDGNRPVKLYVFPSGGGEPATLDSYDLPTSVEAGDLDGDGDDDLVVAHNGWGAVTVHLQEDGGLSAYALSYIPVGELSQDAVAIGDVTGDGCADVVVADLLNGVHVLAGERCGETLPDEVPEDTGDSGAPDDTGADTAAADTAAADTAGADPDPADPSKGGGCGCASDGAAPAWLAGLALLAARRRSRR